MNHFQLVFDIYKELNKEDDLHFQEFKKDIKDNKHFSNFRYYFLYSAFLITKIVENLVDENYLKNDVLLFPNIQKDMYIEYIKQIFDNVEDSDTDKQIKEMYKLSQKQTEIIFLLCVSNFYTSAIRKIQELEILKDNKIEKGTEK